MMTWSFKKIRGFIIDKKTLGTYYWIVLLSSFGFVLKNSIH